MGELINKINAQKWTFAKTYAKFAPHEYIVNKQNPELFNTICNLIDEFGYEKEFTLFGHTKVYKYINIGEYKYWHFDIILNREKLPDDTKRQM